MISPDIVEAAAYEIMCRAAIGIPEDYQTGIRSMWILRVENFGPLLVESDLAGNSLFERNNAQVNARVEGLYAGLKPPVLSRYGETRDKTEELI